MWIDRAFTLAALLVCGEAARAQEAGVQDEVRELAKAAAGQLKSGARVEVEVGQLNPRLHLASCNKVQPYLPPGLPMWGRTRIGLRCADGPVRWNVSLPVTVKVFAPALVAAQALPAGTVLSREQLSVAEVDLAAEPGTAFAGGEAAALVGRSLARPLAAGDALRVTSLSKRQFFAAGETVTVQASGAGFSIGSAGQALSPGIEGQDVRIRLENGRTVTGRAVGERQVEVLL
ncbi:MAG: flagellar basal body P-ring formation protein FlgA [Paucibacter sp.]|nr:flagellar basal body P-ring formation protein FlgA [Roseateles sp.]